MQSKLTQRRKGAEESGITFYETIIPDFTAALRLGAFA